MSGQLNDFWPLDLFDYGSDIVIVELYYRKSINYELLQYVTARDMAKTFFVFLVL